MAPASAAGDEWRRQLPRLVAECAERWDLAVGDRLAGGLVGHVVACTTSAGEAAVLKLNPPASAGQPATPEQEAAALRAWRGRGAVELLAFAPDLCALLTRRALPGTPLAAGSDRRARREVARVLADLFGAAVPPEPLLPLARAADDYLAAKRAAAGPAAPTLGPLVEEARASAARLSGSATAEVLLHGDVMDKNLLWHGDRLVAIDPMPAVGDPHSDVGFWAATRSPAGEVVARAADLARRLDLDAGRAARWGAVYAAGEACLTWRRDTEELRAWVRSAEARELLTE